MRTFAAITAGGVLSVLLLKLIAAVFFPVLGMIVGILMLGVKMMLLAIVVYVVYSLIFKRRKERSENA
jgi:hypothetical protein